jgi:hypothetical protein
VLCRPGEEDQLPSYTLTFNIEFPHDDDQVYLAHCYPYTYTDLQDYLIQMQVNVLSYQCDVWTVIEQIKWDV